MTVWASEIVGGNEHFSETAFSGGGRSCRQKRFDPKKKKKKKKKKRARISGVFGFSRLSE